jgi:MFS family permease
MTNVAGYREVLANRTTRRLLLASVVSTLGDFVGTGALLVLAYDRSGGLAIAGAGLIAATGAGSLTVSLLGGPTLDRLDRRRGLVAAEIVSAAAIVLPLVVTILWPIYIAAFVLGACRAATVSLRHGVLADAVPERLRSGLLGLMGTSDQAGQVLGYASGAWLAVSLTARVALALDLVTFVVGALVLAGLVVPARAPTDDHVSVLAGWRAIAGHPQLRLLAVLIAASAAASAMPETLAPLVVGEDSPWLPLVMAAGPAGGVLGFAVAGRLHSTTVFGGQLVHLSLYGVVVALGTVVAGPVGFILVNVGAGAGAAWLIGPQVTFIRLAPTQHIAQISASMLALVMLSEGGWVLLAGAVADRFGVATA